MLLLVVVLFSIADIHGQSQTDMKHQELLIQKQDSLSLYGRLIQESTDPASRFRADSFFTRILVRALKTKNSFYFPFDSLATTSRVYSPDSLFRVFTWQVSRDENLHRRHGAIQMKTSDGSLKLFPLIDRSFLINNQKDTVTNHEWWIGSIYYKIILKEYNNKKYYR